ncbi:MAG: HEAT repeat domain-containing protein [Deltaproteobacteria bacterium]|jgi:hypothetical protein|nr:HEAT repeat domain-containing protein [Deltaproteobacteria bacterium]
MARNPSRGQSRWGFLYAFVVVGTAAIVLFLLLPDPPLSEDLSRASAREDPGTALDVARWPSPRAETPGALAESAPSRVAAAAALGKALRRLGSSHEPTLGEAIDIALDPHADLTSRVEAIRWLALREADEALEVLRHLLHAEAEPSFIKAQAAEALGRSPHPAAGDLLEDLLASHDDEIARGALRGLGERPEAPGLELLLDFATDETRSDRLRSSAAERLGEVDPVAAAALLEESLAFELEEDPIAASLLEGMARGTNASLDRDFRPILESPDVPKTLKLAALDALDEARSEAATGLLLETARSADDPGLRSAALASLDVAEGDTRLHSALVGLATLESDPSVRSELYRSLALSPGTTFDAGDPGALVERIAGETDAGARLHGYRLIAGVLRLIPDPRLSEPFDTAMVPWLRDEAMGAPDAYTRGVAVDALKLANTTAAREALRDLSYAEQPELVAAAEQALTFPSPMSVTALSGSGE